MLRLSQLSNRLRLWRPSKERKIPIEEQDTDNEEEEEEEPEEEEPKEEEEEEPFKEEEEEEPFEMEGNEPEEYMLETREGPTKEDDDLLSDGGTPLFEEKVTRLKYDQMKNRYKRKLKGIQEDLENMSRLVDNQWDKMKRIQKERDKLSSWL